MYCKFFISIILLIFLSFPILQRAGLGHIFSKSNQDHHHCHMDNPFCFMDSLLCQHYHSLEKEKRESNHYQQHSPKRSTSKEDCSLKCNYSQSHLPILTFQEPFIYIGQLFLKPILLSYSLCIESDRLPLESYLCPSEKPPELIFYPT